MSTTSSPNRRPFGQPPGIISFVLQRVLDLALQQIAAKDAQTREVVGRIIAFGSRQVSAGSRKVNLDQVGDEDRCDVGAILLKLRADEFCQLRSFCVFAK